MNDVLSTNRRQFLLGSAAVSTLALTSTSCLAESGEQNPSNRTFPYGIASGDPTQTSLVIWTQAEGQARVEWQLATDEQFKTVAKSGVASTGPSKDFTVKVDVNGLKPGVQYYYRFSSNGKLSPVGRAKTLPVGRVDSLNIAVASCSNYVFGLFNAYAHIANDKNIDYVLHLGDYIYEYGDDGWGAESGKLLNRVHQPTNEIVSLQDYRTRHRQYKSDHGSQLMHAAHPLIPIWDDHESTNNPYVDGAQNHQPEQEGDWHTRRAASIQAYYEWMPVREPEMAPEAFFRSFSYGDLLTIAAVETRLMARAQQFEYSEIIPTLQSAEDVAHFTETILWDETREMLGAAQLDYLDRTLRNSVASGQPWRLIANQVTMAKVTAPDLTPHVTEEQIAELEQQWDQARAFVKSSALGLPLNLDAWDGYPAARERFYDVVRDAGAAGMIVVTGDTHTWWANDLVDKNGGHMGVELGTHSVTSPSPYRKEFLGGKGAEYALLTNRDNKDVRFLSGEYHGFIDLTIMRDAARAEFVGVDNIESSAYNAFTHVAFDIKKTKSGAELDDIDGASFKEGFLF